MRLIPFYLPDGALIIGIPGFVLTKTDTKTVKNSFESTRNEDFLQRNLRFDQLETCQLIINRFLKVINKFFSIEE